MKPTITIPQFEGIIASIVHDAEETAKLKHEVFIGIPDAEMLSQLTKRIGKDWVLTKDTFKFFESDIIAVSGNRFYRKTGVKLLTLLLGIIVILWALALTFPMIPMYLYGVLVGITFVVIFYFYVTKLKKARTELLNIVYHRTQLEK